MSCVNSVEVPVCGLKFDLDLDNLEIPTVGGGGIDYSTEEQWTGLHWIDGKKIYQKTVFINLSGTVNSDRYFPLGVQNVDEYVSYQAFLKQNDRSFIHLPHTSNSQIKAYLQGDSLRIHTYTHSWVGRIQITLQYTCTDR